MNAQWAEPWAPIGSDVELMPAGHWWDAVKLSAALGAHVLARLEDASGAVITDGYAYCWLIQPRSARAWEGMAGVQVLGPACYVAVPPAIPAPRAMVQWLVPVSMDRCLTDAGLFMTHCGR
jgi:hypothetical protein